MSKIAVVTDSTADLPPRWYQEHNVFMVPLEVRFGDDVYRDWLDITPAEFYQRLSREERLPKTSQPTPAAFTAVYERAAADYDEIISLHLSSELSGTLESAAIAARQAKVPVRLVDTRQASLAIGIIVQAVAAARDAGKSMNELLSLAADMIAKMRIFFYVDTLKYLQKGGRLGKAAALAGALLNVKVILTLDDGVVAPAARVRGRRKVIRAIVDLIAREFPDKAPRLALARAGGGAENLAAVKTALKERGYATDGVLESEIGAVIGTYTGPGTIAVVAY